MSYVQESYKPKGKSWLIDLLEAKPKVSLVAVVVVSLLVRFSLIYAPHSGFDNAPKYGDYEAQRHWMELTYNLP